MTREQQNILVEQAKAGDQTARDHLILSMRDMVRLIAHRMQKRCMDRVDADDLTTVGIFALINCIPGFDPAKGTRFSSYATHRIRGAMLDYLRANDIVPRLVRARTKRLDAAREAFLAAHGRAPDRRELQQATKLDDATFNRYAREILRDKQSLDHTLTGTDSKRAAYTRDTICDPRSEQDINAVDARDLLRHVLDRHGLRAALMLKLHYLDQWPMSKVGTAFMPSFNKGQWRKKHRSDTISESAICTSLKRLITAVRIDLGVGYGGD